jgi:hypothetical protein
VSGMWESSLAPDYNFVLAKTPLELSWGFMGLVLGFMVFCWGFMVLVLGFMGFLGGFTPTKEELNILI